MASDPKLADAHADVVSKYKAHCKELLKAAAGLRALHFQFDQEGFPAALVDEAFTGTNGNSTNKNVSRELLAAARSALDSLDAAATAKGEEEGAMSLFGILYKVGG